MFSGYNCTGPACGLIFQVLTIRPTAYLELLIIHPLGDASAGLLITKCSLHGAFAPRAISLIFDSRGTRKNVEAGAKELSPLTQDQLLEQ